MLLLKAENKGIGLATNGAGLNSSSWTTGGGFMMALSFVDKKGDSGTVSGL